MQDEGDCLPGGGHDEDPAVALLEDEGFDNVGCEEEAEEDSDGNGGGECWVIVVVGVAGVDGDEAVFARCRCRAAGGEDILG